MTREEIQQRIDEISNALKGPNVSNFDRLLLNEDRHDLRAMLRDIDAQEVSSLSP